MDLVTSRTAQCLEPMDHRGPDDRGACSISAAGHKWYSLEFLVPTFSGSAESAYFQFRQLAVTGGAPKGLFPIQFS